MIGIDTNVVVRFLVADDVRQFRQVDRLIRENQVFVTLTVLLESEWVLRSQYGLPQSRIVKALQNFAGLPTVRIEDLSRAMKALDWTEKGLDFADALHLTGVAEGGVFASFDRRLGKVARRLDAPEVPQP